MFIILFENINPVSMKIKTGFIDFWRLNIFNFIYEFSIFHKTIFFLFIKTANVSIYR